MRIRGHAVLAEVQEELPPDLMCISESLRLEQYTYWLVSILLEMKPRQYRSWTAASY